MLPSSSSMEKREKSIFNVFWMGKRKKENGNYQNNLQLNYNMYAVEREV
jgi:hypothetical protein